MRAIGLSILAGALLCATPAWTQTAAATAEVERYQAEGSRMLEEHREATQRKIDRASKALQAQDYRAARKDAQAVTRADPKRVEAWLLLGSAQMGLRDWPGARKAYTAAIRIWPGHPEARAGLGVAMARISDPRAAVQLAWFDRQLQACDGCYQAPRLTKYKSEVEAAIAEATPKGS
jgi:cytochrome c-type biogenesis protein CcmH/NrfG